MRRQKAWTTHMPTLIKAVQSTDGAVAELGAGIFSTPLLHWLCAEDNRKLVSFEDVERYWKIAYGFRSRNHKIVRVDDWDDIDISGNWDVVFIDHRADRRVIDALRFKDTAKFVVLHDSEHPAYGYDRLWPEFKYEHHWRFCRPWTSVVSNFSPFPT